MRWKAAFLFAVCIVAASAWAQSLGDVAREQRKNEDPNKPKARVTLTNDEIARPETPAPAPTPPKPGAPSTLENQNKQLAQKLKQNESLLWRIKITEVRSRISHLESEIKDLEARRNQVAHPKRGDPAMDPFKRAEATKALDQALVDERKELATTKDELEDQRRQAKSRGFTY